jgi:hypothetical protein
MAAVATASTSTTTTTCENKIEKNKKILIFTRIKLSSKKMKIID